MIDPVALIKRDAWFERCSRLLRSGLRRTKKLELEETLSLGDRRVIALVRFEGARFLVGGTSNSLSLLARLEDRGATEGSAKNAAPTSGDPGDAE